MRKLRTIGTPSSADTGPGNRFLGCLALAVAVALPGAPAHAGTGPLTILLKGNLTTSSQLFLNPDAAEIAQRIESITLSDCFGVGVEVKYRIPETSVAIGFSTDFIRARTSSFLSAFPRQIIPVEDGYTVVPVELTGYFIIPFSGETFGVYMGGGAGLYFGSRSYRLGITDARSTSTKPGFGIHVLGGVRYRFWGPLEAVFEMKFRDLHFEAENAFDESPIRYNDTVVKVSTVPFRSRTQTDGIIFQLGLGVSF